jgi:hypothetical protein
MSILLAVERDTTCAHTAGSGKGYTLHVLTAGGGMGYTLRHPYAGGGKNTPCMFHTAGGGQGYTLHVHTVLMEVERDTPCTSILLAVERDTPCDIHSANEEPVRIQYKCLVPSFVFPEMKLLFPK